LIYMQLTPWFTALGPCGVPGKSPHLLSEKVLTVTPRRAT
jgi:hypothetical protein